ncbi:SLBB domain-containing protein [Porticoccaceae bacterium]|nr:SLBB domain-containing protein [Porticoccaceae bacterium]
MRNKSPLIGICLGIFTLFSTVTFAQQPADVSASLNEAKQMCASLSDANKALARSAGYDIEKLCSSLDILGEGAFGADTEVEKPVVVPRGTDITDPDAIEKALELEEDNLALKKLQRATSDDLQPFGYELFAGEPTSFESAARIPVSPDYLLGPGDNLEVLLFGNVNDSYSLAVGRNGAIDFPSLGPINVSGMTFSETKELLHKRITEQMLGVEASISLGELRSIQVFILGEAYKPGTYTISSLSTITNALFVSGGVNDIASLRNIQLKRSGKVIATLDLYDLLLRGDTADDLRLQSSDVIYIPSVRTTASVEGEVRRPAIYELKGETTVAELLELAGGTLPKAFQNGARISRINHSGFMAVVDANLSTKEGQNLKIDNGDLLTVGSVADHKELVVSLDGHVYHPGDFLWQPNLRVSDIVKDIKHLKSNVDLNFALIRRELPPVGRLESVFVDLGGALANKGSESDTVFFPRDRLTIFAAEEGRAALVAKVVSALKAQSHSGEKAQIAVINGTVKSPGEYPLTKNMTLTQLIAAAGGLNEEAYTQYVELSRYDFSDIERATSDHVTLNLATAYANADSDPVLEPYDVVSIRAIPEFRESLTVVLEGEVRFPGVYAFKRGELLSDVLKRAGGLSDLAHAKAAVFTRETLRVQEQEQLDNLTQRLKSDIAAAGLEKSNEGKSTDIEGAEKLLEELSESEALGRLVVNLQGILDGSEDDVKLKGGDRLVIPEYRQEVTVLGEVQQSTAHLYSAKLKVNDYIELSGGTNIRADEKRVYVVKVDGSVKLPHRTGWLSRRAMSVEPGDTIIVPLDVERRRVLTVWTEASQVVYQLALGAAAINSF